METTTMDATTMEVLGVDGVVFEVRIVRQGESYGRGAVHDSADPLVEFWHVGDVRTRKTDPYLVSAYYCSTLVDAARDDVGLALDGGFPRYDVPGRSMAVVRAWLREVCDVRNGVARRA